MPVEVPEKPKAKKIERGARRLVRAVMMWQCTKCKKMYGTYPDRCVCGQFPPTFVEKTTAVSDELSRKDYMVNSNFLFQGEQIDKGTYISLPDCDELTEDLAGRGLVTEVV